MFLILENIFAGYNGCDILKGINLEINRGDFVGIIGPNGSGKSTLIRVISQTIKQSLGKILLDGKDLSALSRKDIARKIAIVPQITIPSSEFTVEEIVMMGRYSHKNRKHETRNNNFLSIASYLQWENEYDYKIVRKAMEFTKIAHLNKRYPSEISGGEFQRVMIAKALAQEPSLLLLDEPTSHLDINYQIEIFELLKKLNNDGLTIIVISHDINIVSEYCHYIILMSQGTIKYKGSTESSSFKKIIEDVYQTRILDLENPITKKKIMVPVAQHCITTFML